MQPIQKTHPVIAQIKASSPREFMAFETAEEAESAFQEVAKFYDKEVVTEVGKSPFFCIRASHKKVSRVAKESGITATVGTVKLVRNHSTRSGVVHWVTYKEGVGSYNELRSLAEQFNINLY